MPTAVRQKFLDSSPPLNPPVPPCGLSPPMVPPRTGGQEWTGDRRGKSPLLPVSYPPSTGDYRGVEAGWGKTVERFMP